MRRCPASPQHRADHLAVRPALDDVLPCGAGGTPFLHAGQPGQRIVVISPGCIRQVAGHLVVAVDLEQVGEVGLGHRADHQARGMDVGKERERRGHASMIRSRDSVR